MCHEDGTYHAGSSLTASWRISRIPLEEIQSLEISVLWYSEGKGDEDLHVHHFHRISENQVRRGARIGEQSIECVLPETPLSYHGKLINIRWCIRLRLYLANGREIVAEQPFYLVSAKTLAPCAAALTGEKPKAGSSGESTQREGSLASASRH